MPYRYLATWLFEREERERGREGEGEREREREKTKGSRSDVNDDTVRPYPTVSETTRDE